MSKPAPTRYRTLNWSAYNASPRERGSLTVWFDPSEVLQSHRFRSGEDLETTLQRYVWLYNQQLPQSAPASKPPLQAIKEWHKPKPELFRKQPYYLPGCGA